MAADATAIPKGEIRDTGCLYFIYKNGREGGRPRGLCVNGGLQDPI
jgi:hypothetical protein